MSKLEFQTYHLFNVIKGDFLIIKLLDKNIYFMIKNLCLNTFMK